MNGLARSVTCQKMYRKHKRLPGPWHRSSREASRSKHLTRLAICKVPVSFVGKFSTNWDPIAGVLVSSWSTFRKVIVFLRNYFDKCRAATKEPRFLHRKRRYSWSTKGCQMSPKSEAHLLFCKCLLICGAICLQGVKSQKTQLKYQGVSHIESHQNPTLLLCLEISPSFTKDFSLICGEISPLCFK